MADKLYNQLVNNPPHEENANKYQWAKDVADALNKLPPTSTFSFTTPNSNVTAQEGTIGVNLNPNAISLWFKESGNTDIGWVSMLSTGGASPVVDHGLTIGIADDDHTQYYNSTRHTATIHNVLGIDHGSLGGRTDDDHSGYLLLAGRSGQTISDYLDITSGVSIGSTTTLRSNLSVTGAVKVSGQVDAGSGLSVASVSTFGDGTNYTHIAANGFQSMAGTARYWHGDDLTPGTVKKGPTPPAADQIGGFAFDRYDRGTEESVFHVWHVPHNMAIGSASVGGHYDFVVENPPSGDTETVVMGFEYKKLSAGDTFDFTTGTSTGTLAVSITSADAAYKLYETGLGYLDTTGWAHDDKILFRFYRDATYAGDTYDNEVTAADNDVWVKTYHIEVLCDTFGESAI